MAFTKLYIIIIITKLHIIHYVIMCYYVIMHYNRNSYHCYGYFITLDVLNTTTCPVGPALNWLLFAFSTIPTLFEGILIIVWQ